jgi:hypothetical protein
MYGAGLYQAFPLYLKPIPQNVGDLWMHKAVCHNLDVSALISQSVQSFQVDIKSDLIDCCLVISCNFPFGTSTALYPCRFKTFRILYNGKRG